MTGFTAFLILFSLLVLRFGVPFVVTLGFGHLMNWVCGNKETAPVLLK